MAKKENNENKHRKDKREGKRKEKTRTTTTCDGEEEDHKKSQNATSQKTIENQPPNKSRVRLQLKNKYHAVNQELCKAPEYSLFGDDIPVIDEGYEYKVGKSKLKTVFERGHIIKGETQNFWSRSYKVVRKLTRGRNVYIVSDASHEDRTYFMKAEVIAPIPRDSNIGREIILLKNSCKTEEPFQNHFLKLIDVGRVEDKYSFMVTRMGGQNILEVCEQLNGMFLCVDAVRLCLQTLQAIHDVHLCCFIHRDIQPKNFVIGSTEADQNIVYIVNFGFSFEYYPKKNYRSLLAKHSGLSRTFQPRAFHTASEYSRLADLESWLYMCFWFFNIKSLPWHDIDVNEERKICNCKELFFSGHFDLGMMKKWNLPKFLFVMRDKLNTESLPSSHDLINYPFFADTIVSVEKQYNVEWKSPYQWQNPDTKPARGSAESVNLQAHKQKKKSKEGKTEEKQEVLETDDKAPADVATSSDNEKKK